MKNLKKLTILSILTLSITITFAQKVENIKPKLVGNNMEITYEITGAEFNQKFDISLYISTDGGITYQGPMTLLDNEKKEVSGGINVLVWDIFKDINALDKELFFDVRAKVIEEKIERKFFIQYYAGALVSSLDYITPIGFRLGTIGKTGWYLAGYFNSFAKASNSFDGESFDEPIFYEFTNKNLYPRMSATAGLTFQLGWKSYLYAGAGYSTKKYFKQINELNIDGTIKNEDQWLNMTTYDEAGVELEVGAILNFSHVNIGFGLSVFNFKHIGANAGIGLTF